MTDVTHILDESGPYAATILNAADYLNAQVAVFRDRHGKLCPIFKLPCGMCEVYTDAEVQDMANKQSVFKSLYPKG